MAKTHVVFAFLLFLLSLLSQKDVTILQHVRRIFSSFHPSSLSLFLSFSLSSKFISSKMSRKNMSLPRFIPDIHIKLKNTKYFLKRDFLSLYLLFSLFLTFFSSLSFLRSFLSLFFSVLLTSLPLLLLSSIHHVFFHPKRNLVTNWNIFFWKTSSFFTLWYNHPSFPIPLAISLSFSLSLSVIKFCPSISNFYFSEGEFLLQSKPSFYNISSHSNLWNSFLGMKILNLNSCNLQSLDFIFWWPVPSISLFLSLFSALFLCIFRSLSFFIKVKEEREVTRKRKAINFEKRIVLKSWQ